MLKKKKGEKNKEKNLSICQSDLYSFGRVIKWKWATAIAFRLTEKTQFCQEELHFSLSLF